MASANKIHHLAEDISATNIFGRCQPELLESSERERRKKEEKFKEEEMLREAEAIRQEIKRLEEEEAFKEFSVKERMAEAKRTYPVFTKGLGRGTLLAMQPHVKKNVNQFCSGYFNTKSELLQTWGNRNIYEDQEDEEEEEAEEESRGGDEGAEINNSPIYYQREQFGVDSKSSDTSEEYTDAESFLTSTYSRSSYNSLSPYSRESPSPVAERQPQTGPRASPPGSKPVRRNRLAARFTNNIEDEQDIIEGVASMKLNQEPYVEQVVEDNHDPLAVLESTRWPLAKKTKTTRKVGTSFKSLSPSQRVLTNNAVTPEQLAVYYNGSADVSDGFTLNVHEFPPLCKATK